MPILKPRRTENLYHVIACAQMYIIIGLTQCPSTDEQINKMWDIYHGILFSYKKKSDNMENLENIMLSETSQL